VAMLQDPDPRNAHVHGYVHTSVHPESIHDVLVGYFDIRGWPLTRRINRIRPRPGIGALHGIEPEGKVHFDLHWIFRENVGIAPADGVENGSNLLLWNRFYIEEFYRDFDFRPVGPEEERVLKDYFGSSHFLDGLDIAGRDDVPHMHINIETSIHPEDFGPYALDALAERGWEVYYLCPNAYMLGDDYTGKLVFMGKKPEKVYDIGWKFNPDVVIKPTEHTWLFDKTVGYDVMTTAMTEDEVNAHPFVRLTEAEIASVLDALRKRLQGALARRALDRGQAARSSR
jgi:hypothetical protein